MDDRAGMNYAHIYDHMQIAKSAFLEFIDDNAEVSKTKKEGAHYVACMKNGDKHYFMTDKSYATWSMGRTYVTNGITRHSGIPVEYVTPRKKKGEVKWNLHIICSLNS